MTENLTTITTRLTPKLPAEYASLERFVQKWALENTHQRAAARAASTIEEMREFYSAALPLAADAAESLRGTPVEDLDDERLVLLKLLLSLVEVGVGVECFNSPHVPNGYPLERVEAVYVPNMAPTLWAALP